MAEIKMPRFMITAPGSNTGKTTIVCGLLKALLKKGLQVAAFKSGPDYIDPMFHTKVIGAHSRNLDVYMLGKETTRYLAAKNGKQADISVFEGAMGYYDGLGKDTTASAYDLACTCDVPVILVVNGKGASLSIAAQIKGFKDFRPDSRIVGAILNNINPMTYLYYKEAIEKESGVKLLGYFPVMEDCNFESRHLGLITAEEIGDLQRIVDSLAAQAEKSLDLEAIFQLARAAAPLNYEEKTITPLGKTKIAIAQDRAFCFYYQDALDLLQELGAKLLPFSPLKDSYIPDCDGIILGGGYPELYAKELSSNISLMKQIKEALEQGMPCLAECGGFMYLLQKYITEAAVYEWVGALQGETQMTQKLRRFGYIELEAQQDNVLCRAGERIRGHEFHYSDSTNNGEVFLARKASGKGSWPCVQGGTSLYAGYPHIHLWGNPVFAQNFVRCCCEYANKK